MIEIKLEKFGNLLTSRQLGKEALAAFLPTLQNVPKDEKIVVDFIGVITLTPSWADEFLTKLFDKYNDRFYLKSSDNLSVKMTLEILEQIINKKFQIF